LLQANIAKIGAARPLQHVPTKGSHVAQLRARRKPQRLGDDRKVVHDIRVTGGSRHAHARAQPKPARSKLDLARGRALQRIDVGDELGLHDVEPHQIDQRCAAGGCAAEPPGAGVIHRTLAELVRSFFVPPITEDPGGHSRMRRPSKLAAGSPIA
jgi:hypothetical protein